MTKAPTPTEPKGRRATTASARLRRPGCRQCPFRGPSGRCRDETLRSGRCGDWVWYVRGGKQLKRLWVKPRDPRTPSQRYWRALLGAASKRYNTALTDDQQDACIAAGAKQRCQPRFGPSGVLTGQQYWVRSQCQGKAEGRVKREAKAGKGLQTQGILASTREPHRYGTSSPPGRRRRNTGRAGQHEGRRKPVECTRPNTRAASDARQNQTITRSTCDQYRIRSVIGPRYDRWAKGRGMRNAPCGTRSGTGARGRWNRHWRELWHGS
jgi:hypothetical protein